MRILCGTIGRYSVSAPVAERDRFTRKFTRDMDFSLDCSVLNHCYSLITNPIRSQFLFPVPLRKMADLDPESLNKLRVVDLREHLSTRGLSTSGLKADLVKRLREAIEAATNGKYMRF